MKEAGFDEAVAWQKTLVPGDQEFIYLQVVIRLYQLAY